MLFLEIQFPLEDAQITVYPKFVKNAIFIQKTQNIGYVQVQRVKQCKSVP